MCKKIKLPEVPGYNYYSSLSDELLEERIKRAESITTCAVAFDVAAEYLGWLLAIREERKA